MLKRNNRHESYSGLYENREALEKYLQKLKELMEPNEIPRRNRVYLWTPAEKAIQNAVDEVEKMGASEKLTKAVILLAEARNLVADHVEGK